MQIIRREGGLGDERGKMLFCFVEIAPGRHLKARDAEAELGQFHRLENPVAGTARGAQCIRAGIDQQQFTAPRGFAARIPLYARPVASHQPIDPLEPATRQVARLPRGAIERLTGQIAHIAQHASHTRYCNARQRDLRRKRCAERRQQQEREGKSGHRLPSVSYFALSMDETGGLVRLIHGRQMTLNPSFEQDLLALLPRLRRFAVGLCGNPADGDDLCQMSLERALANRDKWREGTRLDSWMYRIMRNLWIDEGRATTRRRETFVTEEAGLSVGGDGAQEAVVELTLVDRAMQQLPADQREAVLLVMVEGYGYREAAEIVGCPVGTLNSRLVRGRDALLTLLGEKA